MLEIVVVLVLAAVSYMRPGCSPTADWEPACPSNSSTNQACSSSALYTTTTEVTTTATADTNPGGVLKQRVQVVLEERPDEVPSDGDLTDTECWQCG